MGLCGRHEIQRICTLYLRFQARRGTNPKKPDRQVNHMLLFSIWHEMKISISIEISIRCGDMQVVRGSALSTSFSTPTRSCMDILKVRDVFCDIFPLRTWARLDCLRWYAKAKSANILWAHGGAGPRRPYVSKRFQFNRSTRLIQVVLKNYFGHSSQNSSHR